MGISQVEVTQFGCWIDGDTRPASTGATFTRQSPYDGSVVGEFANGNESDAVLAVASARRAFDAGPWPTALARERHRILTRAAELLETRSAFVAERMVLEGGKPVTAALGEVRGAINVLDYYAGLALAVEGSAINSRATAAVGLILREPIGVAALITPWNFPLGAVICKVAPALAAGCTVVAKPSHWCPSPTLLLAQYLAEAGLPDGAFNVVTSDLEGGAVVGQFLAASTDVDKVAFTGSTTTGRAVMRAAASNTKRISLELGGKSAHIVFEDAPLEEAAASVVGGFCFNSGQQCSAGSRLLVQRGIHDRLVEAVAERAQAQSLGDPRSEATTMGPLISEDQLKRVVRYIDVGRAEGELAVGGGQPEHVDCDPNLFVEPTVFDNVSNSSRIAQEEVFGPVLAVVEFETEAEAVRLANDSPYGLAGGVWSASIDTAFRVAKSVRTGRMFVNCYNNSGIDDMPHGGYKQSGFGREYGLQGLAEFEQIKTVQIKFGA